MKIFCFAGGAMVVNLGIKRVEPKPPNKHHTALDCSLVKLD